MKDLLRALALQGQRLASPLGTRGRGLRFRPSSLAVHHENPKKEKNGEIKARDNDLLRANNAVSQPAMKSTLQKIRAEESSQVVGTSREWHR
jgi:hypothetical protein